MLGEDKKMTHEIFLIFFSTAIKQIKKRLRPGPVGTDCTYVSKPHNSNSNVVCYEGNVIICLEFKVGDEG